MIIKTYNKIANCGLSLFDKESGFQIFLEEEEGENPDAIVCRSKDLNDFTFSPSLQAVGRAGAGVNNIPVSDLTEKGVVVFNAPGANANSVVELVLAGMLEAARNLDKVACWQVGLGIVGPAGPTTSGPGLKEMIEKKKKTFVGTELRGKILSVMGLGAIGSRLVFVAQALGMTVRGYDPQINPTVLSSLQDMSNFEYFSDMEVFLQEADFVSIHIPATPENERLMNAEKIKLMAPGSVLLNFSRAEVVNVSDICDALAKKQLGRYVTDFVVGELLDCEEVLWFPHLGASTQEAEDNCATLACNSVRDYLLTGNIKNSVNFPDISFPPAAGNARLVVLRKDSKSAEIWLNNIFPVHSQFHTVGSRGTAVTGIILDSVDALQLEKIKAHEDIYSYRCLQSAVSSASVSSSAIA